MSTTTPLPSSTEQRLLAAIVFTDVAGFSTRVEVEESVTLALLERDFLTMRLFSTMHSGTVIKSTGDGLLLYFTSAVQAVEWALKTQRHFADQATSLPATELLQHRIGIHVGEIIMRGGDVMGDGVNVAARVQTEARAGGICISQVVYGVVKNKLKLDVIRLEARKLKNIAESVQMYHVLLEAPSIKTAAPMVPKTEEAAPRKPGLSSRALVLSAVAVLMVGGVVWFFIRAQRAHQEELAGSAVVRNALGEALRTEQNQPAITVTPAPTSASNGTETPAAPAAKPAPEIDFIKLTTVRPAGQSTPAEQEALKKATEALPPLNAWIPGALARWTKGRPLAVRPLSAASQQAWTVFTDANHQLYFAEGGAYRKRDWADLKADVQGAIIASLFMSSSTPLTRDVVRGAEAFAYLNGLPELAEKLAR